MRNWFSKSLKKSMEIKYSIFFLYTKVLTWPGTANSKQWQGAVPLFLTKTIMFMIFYSLKKMERKKANISSQESQWIFLVKTSKQKCLLLNVHRMEYILLYYVYRSDRHDQSLEKSLYVSNF